MAPRSRARCAGLGVCCAAGAFPASCGDSKVSIAGSQSRWMQHATDAAGCVAVGAAYFALAWLSTHMTPRTGDIAYLWPAGGFILGMLLVAPKRLWIPFALSALAADVAHAQTVSDSLGMSLAYSSAYISVLLLSSALLRRWAGAPLRFDSMRRLALFVVIAPVVGNLLAATLGAAISHWSGAPFGESLRAWWVSDALGMLLITPLVVAWSDFRATELRRLTRAVVRRRRSVRSRPGVRQPLGVRHTACAERGGAPAHALLDSVPGVGGAALGRARPEHSGDDRVRNLGVGHDERPGTVLGSLRARRQLGAVPAGVPHRRRDDDLDRRRRDEGAPRRPARGRRVASALPDRGGVEREPGL